MKNHTKVYVNFFDAQFGEFIPCEMCGKKAVDIHHIEARQSGGSKLKDNIENLMALCRKCHIHYGDKKQYKQLLKDKHNDRIKTRISKT